MTESSWSISGGYGPKYFNISVFEEEDSMCTLE